MIRYALIFHCIISCIKLRVAPWKFFQLNREFFCEKKGMYSKKHLNEIIPKKWQLKFLPAINEKDIKKLHFPVFAKPEWGQNANGIIRIDSGLDIPQAQEKISQSKIDYIIQEAATEEKEFDIFYIRSAENYKNYDLLTIAQLESNTQESFPIHSAYNKNSIFKDISSKFSTEEKKILWNFMEEIAQFYIARIGIKAESKAHLLDGKFKVIEINLFTPMPVNLLDKSLSKKQIQKFIQESMYSLAKNIKNIEEQNISKNIFWKKCKKHYQLKYFNS
jgi:D-alanine-D-alanine ligase-like ATP-grasp enzyme